MNFTYFRKSIYSKEETVNNFKSIVSKNGLTMLGEMPLHEAHGTLFHACNDKWVTEVLNTDRNLLGLLPCEFLISEVNGEVFVGSGNPSILGGVSASKKIQQLALDAEILARKVVNETAGSGAQKVAHIKMYSTTTCPYCTIEKEWLDSKGLEHEVVFVDKNQEEAENMVNKTGQMGVPVTEIEYDDGEVEYIVGFDKPKLSRILDL